MKGRVYTDYDPVKIMWVKDTNATEERMNASALKAGLSGSFQSIDENSVPQSREDREIWKFDSLDKKVKVDSVKKAKKDADKATREAEEQAILLKMKISRDEYKKINKAVR